MKSLAFQGFGYIDFSTEPEIREALKMDRTVIDGRPMYVSEYKPHDKGKSAEFRYSTGLERNKVFVNNVHYDASEEQLKVCIVYVVSDSLLLFFDFFIFLEHSLREVFFFVMKLCEIPTMLQ